MQTDEHGKMIERRCGEDRRAIGRAMAGQERRKREAAITDLILELRARNQNVIAACEAAKAA